MGPQEAVLGGEGSKNQRSVAMATGRLQGDALHCKGDSVAPCTFPVTLATCLQTRRRRCQAPRGSGREEAQGGRVAVVWAPCAPVLPPASPLTLGGSCPSRLSAFMGRTWTKRAGRLQEGPCLLQTPSRPSETGLQITWPDRPQVKAEEMQNPGEGPRMGMG